MKEFFKNLGEYIQKYYIDHLFFCFLYTLFWSVLFTPGAGRFDAFLNSCIILSFHALVCYFNNYYLIIELLFKRKYIIYIAAVVLSILSIIFPLALLFHKFFSLDEESKKSIWSFTFFLFNFSSVMFSVAITSVIKLIKSWYVRDQAHKDLKKTTMESELRFLKSQINPHFLFNVLNSLYALTLKKSELAPDIVLKLSNILRYVLYEGASQKQVPFYKEIEYLESYLELEKIRLGERVKVDLEIKGDFTNKYIEPMLFINFVENSFKHGAAGNIDKAWVDIKLELSNNIVLLNVKNSLGKNKIKKDKTYVGGIGLANTAKRLNLLYPNRHDLEIEEKEGKFEVQLKINLNE